MMGKLKTILKKWLVQGHSGMQTSKAKTKSQELQTRQESDLLKVPYLCNN